MTTLGLSLTRDSVAQRREQVAALTRAGYSASQIASRLGVTERTVQRHRQQAGLSQPPAPQLTVEEIDIARRLLDDGASYNEVARTLRRNPETVAKRFPGRGWTRAQVNEWVSVMRRWERVA